MSKQIPADPVARAEREIVLLLRKAEGTDNEHERQTFMDAALRKTVRLGLDEARIRARLDERAEREKPEQITTLVVTLRPPFVLAWHSVATSLAAGLGGLRVVRMVQRGAQPLHVVGFESDVERWHLLYASVQAQAIAAMEEWWRTAPVLASFPRQDHHQFKQSFLTAFAGAVQNRLAAFRKDETEHAGGGTDLALRDRERAVAREYERLHPYTHNTRRQPYVREGHGEGHEAGRRADLGGPRFGGGATPLGR